MMLANTIAQPLSIAAPIQQYAMPQQQASSQPQTPAGPEMAPALNPVTGQVGLALTVNKAVYPTAMFKESYLLRATMVSISISLRYSCC